MKFNLGITFQGRGFFSSFALVMAVHWYDGGTDVDEF